MNLAFNSFGAGEGESTGSAAQALGPALMKNQQLTSLDLSYNAIQAPAAMVRYVARARAPVARGELRGGS